MPGVIETLGVGEPVGAARVLCVVVHGRNQSPEEMQAAIVNRLSCPGVAFALPRAGDRCWYSALAVAPLTDITRAELSASLAGLGAALAGLRRQAPGVPLLLCGFSQGACLSLEHLFTGTNRPDAVAALTGCRVGTADCLRPAAPAPGVPVYLSGGDADPWIPLSAFSQAGAELGAARTRLRADVFPERPHEVCAAEIAMLDALLGDLAAGRPAAMAAAR
jgi:phospholipase/carboxylesterase